MGAVRQEFGSRSDEMIRIRDHMTFVLAEYVHSGEGGTLSLEQTDRETFNQEMARVNADVQAGVVARHCSLLTGFSWPYMVLIRSDVPISAVATADITHFMSVWALGGGS